MRILIAPLGIPLNTSGPAARLKTLVQEGVRRGHELMVCAAQDGNISPAMMPQGVRWKGTPVPTIMGLPRLVGKVLPLILNSVGVMRKAEIASFEQVLKLGGILKTDFFAEDVLCLRRAIKDFRPDVVFSEYRMQAVAASLLENIPVVGTHSFPGQAEFAASPELSEEVRRWLVSQGIAHIDSILRLPELMETRFIASSPELEPFDAPVIHVGPLTPLVVPETKIDTNLPKKRIVLYMGNSSISPSKMVTVGKALSSSGFEVYISARGYKKSSIGGCHIAERFDFSKLLPGAIAFINHGGQNSLMQGLVCAVPQIIFPGKVFERKYNAQSVARLGAGAALEDTSFTPADLIENIKTLSAAKAHCKALEIGTRLVSLGGASKVYDVLEKRFGTA
jgi:UDP:flavonoid glycosyltransferase YjiC (YdhE family)